MSDVIELGELYYVKYYIVNQCLCLDTSV